MKNLSSFVFLKSFCPSMNDIALLPSLGVFHMRTTKRYWKSHVSRFPTPREALLKLLRAVFKKRNGSIDTILAAGEASLFARGISQDDDGKALLEVSRFTFSTNPQKKRSAIEIAGWVSANQARNGSY
jgi:hypothetical protein